MDRRKSLSLEDLFGAGLERLTIDLGVKNEFKLHPVII
jgi:hypothetical protein